MSRLARFVTRLGLWLVTVTPLPLAAAPAAKSATPGASRPAVEMLLGSDHAPTERELKELGGGLDRVLIEIADDGKATLPVRLRAVAALGTVGGAMAVAALDRWLLTFEKASNDADRALVRKAALARGWLGGEDSPARLSPLLRHPDGNVRIDGAVALSLTRQPDAVAPLKARLEDEKDAAVAKQIARHLRTLEKALPAPKANKPTPERTRLAPVPPRPTDPQPGRTSPFN